MNQLTQFNGTPVSIIDHNGKKWLTAEEIGLCLGYTKDNARDGIIRLYNRNTDEFTETDTCTVKLTAQDQLREMRIFSETGCNKLGFFSNTPKSKEFRHWAAQVLVGQVPAPVPIAAPKKNGRISHAGTKCTVTRRIERQVFELFVAGQRPRQISEQLGVSLSAVSLMLHAKYQFSFSDGAPECTPALIAAVAARHLEVEREKLLEEQERVAQKFLCESNNRQLAQALDAVGQQLLPLARIGGAA